jgi:3-oxoacyl-[acyl-carrier-protein] synthase II
MVMPAALRVDEPRAESVVVTGLGAVSPLGVGVPALWSGLLQGRSGITSVDDDWPPDIPVRIAGRVPDEVSALLSSKQSRALDRVQQLAVLAAREAWADAGSPEVDPERLAVVVGSGVGGLLTLLSQHEVMREAGPRLLSPFAIPKLMANGPAAAIGLELRARAGVHTPVSACASGAEAVALGFDLLRAGRADVVVCGGAEASVHPLPLSGFAAMRALSRRQGDPREASRPFDKNRDGFVLGEGSGILVLEGAEHARRRGARVHAELAGAGVSADSHHVVQPDPHGDGAARAMVAAMANAGIGPESVVHVNAHGTSTPLGDLAEAKAIRRALGATVGGRVPVSGTKSMTGHLLGAAGAVEAVITTLTVQDRLAPPTLNLTDLDDEIELDVVHGEPRSLRHGMVLSNSFGFGGHNVSLAFGPAASNPVLRLWA